MRFPTIRYLRWAKQSIEVDPPAFDLASSGIERPPVELAGLGDLSGLPIGGNNARGHPRLRERIAALYGVGSERVLTAAGTSLANFLMLAQLVEPQATVLCEQPAYEPLHRVPEGLGAAIRWIPRPRERGFQPDLDAIERGLAEGARLVILSDLHNPTAVRLDAEVRGALADLLETHGAYALVDEVYLLGMLSEPPPRSAATFTERIVTTSSLTKTYGLGGLRAGWAIAPADLVDRAYEMNDHLGVEAPYLTDEATLRALDHLPALTKRGRLRREANLPLVRDFARARGLEWNEPAGGFMAWVGLPAGIQAEPLSRHLRERYETQVTPGDFFEDPTHLRVGFGAPTAIVEEGLRRLGEALDDLAA